jgi:hypothetical protein
MQSTCPPMKSPCTIQLPLMLCIAGFSLAAPLQGQNLLRNGGFADGLSDWVVPAALQGWTPLKAGGYCASDVEDWTYNGTVLFQNLNYPGVSGKQLNVSIDIRDDWEPWMPPAVLTVDYIATGGQRVSMELLEIQPADVTGEWNTVMGSATLPMMAERLVGISVDRLNGVSIQFDNIRLEGVGLAGDPLPELAMVRPYVVQHGQTIVLHGGSFGSTIGKVLLDGSEVGVGVDNWATDRIEISLAPARGSGRLIVETAEGARSSEVRGIEVASPYLRVGMPRDKLQALVGQVINFEAYVQAHNGYTPNGPVVFSCPELPGAASFIPAMLSGSGGTAVELDLTGLSAGSHTLTLQAMDGGGVAFTAPFIVELLVLDHIVLSYNDSSWEKVTVDDSLSISEQFNMDAFVDLFGPGDEPLPWDLKPLVWTTDNPAVLQLFSDQWGGVKLLPQDNGSCNLTITGPGGFTRSYPVTVDLPDSPKVTMTWFSSNPIPNDGELNHTFQATAVPEIGSVGITGMLNTDYTDIDFSSSPVTWEFSLTEGHDPGKFLFEAGARNGGGRGIVLEVVNAPTHAQISGLVRMLGEPEQMHSQGTLEAYDAASGAKVYERRNCSATARNTSPATCLPAVTSCGSSPIRGFPSWRRSGIPARPRWRKRRW